MTKLFRRLGYFGSAILREYTPGAWFLARMRLSGMLPENLSAVAEDVLDRVAYYNQLKPGAALPTARLGDLSASSASSSEIMYYIDLMRYAQGFGSEFRIMPLFGDVIHVPDQPSVVKSRPIVGDLANSVLMPLDALRHLHFPVDSLTWEQKKPFAVWRGRSNGQVPRIAAAQRFSTHATFDIGQIDEQPDLPTPKPFLSIREQLGYRYILSLEGHDVATNLKWIMGSNSVALAPRPEYETWYMEGRLVPGEHFVEIAPDLSDLEEKVTWCEANPQQVQRIIRNAQNWTRPFRDHRKEQLIAALVLLKYAEMTSGAPLVTTDARFFSS